MYFHVLPFGLSLAYSFLRYSAYKRKIDQFLLGDGESGFGRWKERKTPEKVYSWRFILV